MAPWVSPGHLRSNPQNPPKSGAVAYALLQGDRRQRQNPQSAWASLACAVMRETLSQKRSRQRRTPSIVLWPPRMWWSSHHKHACIYTHTNSKKWRKEEGRKNICKKKKMSTSSKGKTGTNVKVMTTGTQLCGSDLDNPSRLLWWNHNSWQARLSCSWLTW